MVRLVTNHPQQLHQDNRFKSAVELFNSREWYSAHDLFEELWHESNEPERRTLQALLQIAVAQLHLERGNCKGATILFGEGLGRLKHPACPDLGLDIDSLCACVEERLKSLQLQSDLDTCNIPIRPA